MYKNYSSTLSCLIGILLLLAACSPKYGAHFAPTQQQTYAYKNTTAAVAPKVAQEPVAVPAAIEDRAVAAGAEAVVMPAPAAPAPTLKAPVAVQKQHKQLMRALRKKLKNMGEEERKAFKDQVMRQLQEQQLSMHIADDDAAMLAPPPGNVDPVVLVIVTILIPPLGVYLHQGEINTKFWISLVLTLLFYFPGLIYSLLVIFDQV